MNKKKIVNELKNTNRVIFYLYNAMYTIIYDDNEYKIYNYSSNYEYSYKSLKDLLNNYRVYGNNLNNLLEDIII